MKVIIFLGPPGSGKGTQARILSRDLNLGLVGMGDLLREEIYKRTKEGDAVAHAVAHGEMPNWPIVRTVFKRYLHELTHDCVVFDGIPRNSVQINDVEDILSSMGASILKVIFLDVPLSVLVYRMMSRLQCSKCGMSYAPDSLKNQTYCNLCGSDDFIKRDDDKEEVIRNRLEIYKDTASSLIEHYKKKNILAVVDGTLPILDVQHQIRKHLGFG